MFMTHISLFPTVSAGSIFLTYCMLPIYKFVMLIANTVILIC